MAGAEGKMERVRFGAVISQGRCEAVSAQDRARGAHGLTGATDHIKRCCCINHVN